MTNYTVPDCLVLKLEETIYETNEIDTSVYILYDISKRIYVIRGKRADDRTIKSNEFSFDCKDEEDVVQFINYIFDRKNLVNEVLYNYSNLDSESNAITFDFLLENQTNRNEICGYNGMKLKKNRLSQILSILKNTNNFFNN